ncbi:tetratricopeptide repeat protein [Candidatus Woesearchaeota archaeon]|nr:tetratricopeptide repeat protein [Candidatus Woesearchaeota archaeon]
MVSWKIFRESAVEVVGENLVELVEKSFKKTGKEINPSKFGDVLLKNKKIDASERDLLNEAYELLKQEEEARTIPGDSEEPEDAKTFADDEEILAQAKPGLPKLKKFTLVDIIGQGGMGRVYKGVDPDLGRPVAVKEILGEAKEWQKKRFQREILLTAKLDQEYRVIRARAVDTDDEGNTYFVMDFVDGKELTEYVENIGRGRTYSLENAIELLAEAIDAISVAHKQGIIHRDIKPDNIMADRRNVKIMDWGLAKEIDDEEIEADEEDIAGTDISRSATFPNLTQDGVAMGTPAFMSPEQAINAKYADERSDIYSFGAILYQILTGESPNKTNIKKKKKESIDVKKILVNLVDFDKPAVPPSKLNKNVPPELESICMKALAKDVEERYQTAEEFRDDLRAYLKRDSVKAHKYSIFSKISRFVQRHPTGTLGALLGTMLIAGGGIGLQTLHSANLQAEAQEAKAKTAEKEKELQKAKAEIMEIRAKTAETELKGQSESLNTLQSLEHLAQNENYYIAALSIINQAIQESQQFWKPYLTRAKHQATFGHHKEAEQDFEKAQELFRQQHRKESVEIWFEAGMYYGLPIAIGGKGEEDRALEYFEKAAKSKTVFGNLAEAVALMIKAKQEINNAEEYIPEAIALSDKLIQDPVAQNIDATWLIRAFIFGASDFHGYERANFRRFADFQRAKEALLQVVTEEKGSPALRNFLAIVVEHESKDKALQIYDLLIAETNKARYYNNRGRLKVELGRIDSGLEDLTQAIQLEPQDPIYYCNRSLALYRKGKIDDALSDLETALRINPEMEEAHFYKAFVLSSQRKSSEALRELDQAIASRPDFSEAHNLRGMINQQLGRTKEAETDYFAAIRFNPQFSDAYRNLGILQYQNNELAQAEQNFKKALEINPTCWQSLFNLGAVYFQTQKYQQSLTYFEQALPHAPDAEKERIKKNIVAVKSKLR